ncbi:MAG: thioesterase family protein [Trueperaceae bacterium]|nr:thioesterase family protein [Truepera sp.]HRN17451.1 thioesterase family protein [Trueperaceae bacterium]HRQ09824.1 thioesterase family protein [Trueperaceae bacterium]
MREIPAGFEVHHELLVTPAMTVDFEDQHDARLGKLHPVYATYWLAKHMELVSRKLILPFLEEGEEGIGHSVSVKHLASALPGMRLRLTARLEAQEGTRVRAACSAVSELGDLVGEGTTVQVILPHAKLLQAFERLRERWADSADGHGNHSAG